MYIFTNASEAGVLNSQDLQPSLPVLLSSSTPSVSSFSEQSKSFTSLAFAQAGSEPVTVQSLDDAHQNSPGGLLEVQVPDPFNKLPK